MRVLPLLFAAATVVVACPEHNELDSRVARRAEGTKDWDYHTSYDWGMKNKNYTTCQTGTHQSPIHLFPSHTAYAHSHQPAFHYPATTNGTLYNWGHGPAFTVSLSGKDYSSNPAMKFDNTTLYLKGWHIHSPSEHLLEGHRARSELHLVHADASGKERAVVGVLIDPGSTFTADSGFFSQFLETVPSWDDSHTKLVVEMDLRKVYEEIGAGATRRSPAGGERGSGGRDGEKQALKQFITYSGSLTSPPCTEGLRWFVSTTVLKLSTSQMQKLLGVSTYSARVVQEVWAHGVNV